MCCVVTPFRDGTGSGYSPLSAPAVLLQKHLSNMIQILRCS